MQEMFAFELKLTDAVSGSAKRAAGAVRNLEEQAKKTGKALDFSSELEKVEHQLKRLQMDPKGARDLFRAQKELREQQRKMGREGFGEAFGEKLGLGKLTTAAFFGDLLAEALIEAIKKPIEMFAEGVKKAFEAGAKEERLNLSYRLMFGQAGGKEKREDQERFAGLTRFTGSEIGELMRPLYMSGMGDKAARQAFATASDLEARTGRPIGEFIEMLAKINNKGGVTEKMLLGVGLNARKFYEELGKSQHVTAEEAKKRAEKPGAINPQALINQITDEVNKAQGGRAGTGGKMLSETMGARWEKLTKLPEEYLEKMSESPAWEAMSNKLGELLERLSPDSPDGKKIMGSLFEAFDKLEGMVDAALKPENIDAFVEGIQSAVKAIGPLVDALTTAATVVKGVASIPSTLVEQRDKVDRIELRDKDQETIRLKAIRDQTRAERGWAPITIHNNVAVHMEGGGSDTDAEKARKVAAEVARHAAAAHERAAKEHGG